ncbi:hypothetical protein PFNF54_01688 [Plasmodium falciparum NF54]|uniref:Uncharacterized protein n=1 Tax=Plasmodium falciparum (isolate NF54) TaxID=5843 RepID=W7JXW4_PLAFO|nr:hypothetical protein PFNF54_01688 [Plasmodium falciparum NF54]
MVAINLIQIFFLLILKLFYFLYINIVYNMVLLKELINIIEFKSMLKELKILYKVGIYKNIKTVWNNVINNEVRKVL